MKNKKKKFRNLALASSVGTSVYVALGWPFFYFMTYAGTPKERKLKELRKKLEKRKEEQRKAREAERAEKMGGKELIDPDSQQPANRKEWFALYHTTVNHPKYEHEEEYEAVRTWCEAQPMEDIYIRSRDRHQLHASYLPAENPERFVIMCHGYRGTRFGSIAHMAEFLHNNHCNILLIDQRCCGESEGKYITFGAKESHDVLGWVDKIQEMNEEHLPIYLFGQSMGAATVLLASGHKLPEEVRGIIADCGFTSMKQQLRDIASGWFHLHWIELLLYRVDFFCVLFGHFAMSQTKTKRALRKNRRPVLFFHGESDTYVFPENTRRNYELCRAEKELVMVPGARHLCSSFVAPGLYRWKLIEFFRKHDDGHIEK